MNFMRFCAVRIRYLESKYTGDGKWHQKITKKHINPDDAFEEADKFLSEHNNKIVESSCHLVLY